MSDQHVAGGLSVLFGELRGQGRVTPIDGLGDRVMLVPNTVSTGAALQDSAHQQAKVHPVQERILSHQRIARRLINGLMKRHVGVNHGMHI